MAEVRALVARRRRRQPPAIRRIERIERVQQPQPALLDRRALAHHRVGQRRRGLDLRQEVRPLRGALDQQQLAVARCQVERRHVGRVAQLSRQRGEAQQVRPRRALLDARLWHEPRPPASAPRGSRQQQRRGQRRRAQRRRPAPARPRSRVHHRSIVRRAASSVNRPRAAAPGDAADRGPAPRRPRANPHAGTPPPAPRSRAMQVRPGHAAPRVNARGRGRPCTTR